MITLRCIAQHFSFVHFHQPDEATVGHPGEHVAEGAGVPRRHRPPVGAELPAQEEVRGEEGGDGEGDVGHLDDGVQDVRPPPGVQRRVVVGLQFSA